MRNIAVTVGDPAGIGPEIVTKLLSRYRPPGVCLVAVGSAEVLRRELERDAESGRASLEIVDAAGLARPGPPDSLECLDIGLSEVPPYGEDSASGGEHAYRALETATRLAADGSFAAIVTAPLSKRSLSLSGRDEAGHTEILARLTGAESVHMMMASESMRVTVITRHIPLAEVPRALTRERIVEAGVVTWDALTRLWGYPEPLLAMAGLNPHAGEQGLFGREEETVIRPALETLRARGVRIEGPFPADTLFHGHRLSRFQAFLACYHDQGLIPFKTVSFGKGVNVTLGLPFVRTSVDHGTAFDIAGRGHASTDSLREAVDLAMLLGRMKDRASSKEAGNYEPS